MDTLETFAQKIGIVFSNIALLELAFTHRSYVNENKDAKEHNERLEFLGDAVLELAVTRHLFIKYPEKQEGELTAVRAALVNTQSISEAAAALGVNEYLRLSKGESKDTGRARQYILANTFEAIIGAIYLDQGYDAAERFIAANLFNKTETIVEQRLWQDSKSRFQEVAQEQLSITPRYEKVGEQGPDHNKMFTVSVLLDNVEVARGEGKSKQEAEQAAAQAALELKGW